MGRKDAPRALQSSLESVWHRLSTMNASCWSDAVAWLGITISLVGIVLVAPGALGYLCRELLYSVRILQRPVETATASGVAEAHGSADAYGVARPPVGAATTQEVALLWQNVENLAKQASALRLVDERQDAQIRALDGGVTQRIRASESRSKQASRATFELNSGGLPIIALGAVTGGLPDSVSGHPTTFMIAVALSVVTCAWCIRLSRRRSH